MTSSFLSAVILFVADFTFCKNVFEKDSLRRKLPLEALITRPNTNMVISTLGLRFSLCKLASVANSETKKELMLALGLDNTSKLKFCYQNFKDPLTRLKRVDMIFLNKIYVKYTDSIEANFITNSSEDFGVEVDKVGFNYHNYATSFINKWIDGASFKRITDFVGPNDITQDTSMLQLSAIYLKTTWESSFDIRVTKNIRFHHFDGKVSFIPMMSKTDSFMYFSDKVNSLQILNIKMGPSRSSITFILPQNTHGLPVLLKKIIQEANFLKNLKKHLRYTFLRISLPKFQIKTTFDFTELLQQFVSKQIFNTTCSGLDGMLSKTGTTKNVHLSKAKQMNFMILDEMGISRYVEGLRMPYLPVTEPPHSPYQPDFVADRPFYFTVDLDTISGDCNEILHGVFYGTE